MAAIFELSPIPVGPSAPSVGPLRGPRAARGAARGVRVVAPVVVALVVVAGAVGSFGRSMPRLVIGDPGAPISSGEVVVVGPGDTLWSIAEEHFPPDARATAVEALEALNGPSVGLELGDVVALPDLG